MNEPAKTIEIKVERTIPASVEEVFDAWLNPKIPGNPWNIADKFILDAKVDGLFYWTMTGIAHYGRFIAIQRPERIQHTWVSPNTLGKESTVMITFKQKGETTLMTLTHSGLPDTANGRGHEDGWNYFLNIFPKQFEGGSSSKNDSMKNENYQTTIEVVKSPMEVFKHITADVAKWWGKEDFSGNSMKLDDEFTIRHGDVHYSKQKVVEVIPGKRVVWSVTESTLNWLEKDKSEWTGTKMIFELIQRDGKTTLHFIHEGLVPEKECYTRVSQGWDMVIKDWLFNFISCGKTT